MSESKLKTYRNFCVAIGSIFAALWIWYQLTLEPFLKGLLLGVLIMTFVFGLFFVWAPPTYSSSNLDHARK